MINRYHRLIFSSRSLLPHWFECLVPLIKIILFPHCLTIKLFVSKINIITLIYNMDSYLFCILGFQDLRGIITRQVGNSFVSCLKMTLMLYSHLLLSRYFSYCSYSKLNSLSQINLYINKSILSRIRGKTSIPKMIPTLKLSCGVSAMNIAAISAPWMISDRKWCFFFLCGKRHSWLLSDNLNGK